MPFLYARAIKLPKLRSVLVPIFLSAISKAWEKTHPMKRIRIHSASIRGYFDLGAGLIESPFVYGQQ